jgi:phytol kinase
MNNGFAVGISFIYVFLALGIAEGLRRAFKWPVEFTRKVVHISVGMWAWGTAALFTNKWLALICPASFIVLNYISYKRGLFLAMESNDKSNLGTVYFPIAFVALILILFDESKFAFALSLMPLTWGDSFAAIVGKRFGKHPYTVFGSQRSIEGSAAMFIFSFFSTAIPIYFHLLPALNWMPFAFVLAAFATAIEMVSPRGLDNILIPASSMLWVTTSLLTGNQPLA